MKLFIECIFCDKKSYLVKKGDDYFCPDCNTQYEDEDGIVDEDEMEDMYKLYLGAKRAGLIKDEETYEEHFLDRPTRQ